MSSYTQRDFGPLLALLAQRSSFVSIDGDPEADSKDPFDMSGFALDVYPDGHLEVWNTYDGDHPLKGGRPVWHGVAELRADGLNEQEMDLPVSNWVGVFEEYLYNELSELLERDDARRQLLQTLAAVQARWQQALQAAEAFGRERGAAVRALRARWPSTDELQAVVRRRIGVLPELDHQVQIRELDAAFWKGCQAPEGTVSDESNAVL